MIIYYGYCGMGVSCRSHLRYMMCSTAVATHLARMCLSLDSNVCQTLFLLHLSVNTLCAS